MFELILETIKKTNFILNKIVCEYGIKAHIYTQSKSSLKYLENYLTNQEKKYIKSLNIFVIINIQLFDIVSFYVQKKKSYKKETFKNKYHNCLEIKENYKDAYKRLSFFYLECPYYYIICWDNNVALLMKDEQKDIPHILLYIYREYIYRTAENFGAVMFHAASIDIDNNGILLVGPQGAGKTTLLINLLESGKGRFVSNDRTLVFPDMSIDTIPMPVRVGLDTLYNTDILYHYVKKNYYDLKRRIDIPLDYIISKKVIQNVKVELTISDIRNCYQLSNKRGLKLNNIVLPDLHSGSKIVKKKIKKENAFKLLLQQKYTPNDPLWKSDWICKRDKKESQLEFESLQLCNTIIENTDVYYLRF